MHADTNIEGDHSCHECRSYEREVKALKSKLDDAQTTLNAVLERFGIAPDHEHRYSLMFDALDSQTSRLSTVSNALEAFVTAAKSWHNFHHGSTNIQCDALCECIPAGEAALSGSVVERQKPKDQSGCSHPNVKGVGNQGRCEDCGMELIRVAGSKDVCGAPCSPQIPRMGIHGICQFAPGHEGEHCAEIISASSQVERQSPKS